MPDWTGSGIENLRQLGLVENSFALGYLLVVL